jgi:DNA polymerase-1
LQKIRRPRRIVGGLAIGRDGRIHPTFLHNPSTLRLSCQNPNIQQLPRTGEADDLQSIIRNLIVADPGCILIERDFSAIESVLVGYFAGSADYIRLSKLGIHAYLASHVIGKPADLAWPDDDLRQYFKQLKGTYKREYNASKRMVHGTNYGMTPRKMVMTEPETFGTQAEAKRIQDIYLGLFPALAKWQLSVQLQAEKDGYLRNPYGYIHRFLSVFSYRKEGKDWKRGQGADSNKVLAFLPQSTAAGIIKDVMLRLFFQYFDEAGQYLRLQVHDSLVLEVPMEKVKEVDTILRSEMEAGIPELRLPNSYGMGDYLSIGSELKSGLRWGSMK